MKRKPLFISGPSGVGKSYLTRYLCEHHNCEKILTLTTRAPRNGEVHGVNYDFISEIDFSHLKNAGLLAVADHLFSASYGLRKGVVEKIYEVGNVPICEVYAPTVHLFTDAFPDYCAIYLLPESIELLRARMRHRGDDEAT
jgi:guanylate kinase